MTDVGTTFAGYRIEEEVGRGGMGLVYRATEIAADRRVALKVILPEYSADPSFRSRFEREARLAAQLAHPNIIPTFETGEHDGQLFLAMQFLEGVDLDTVIVRESRLHPRHAAPIIAQVAAALDAAHRQGLVHRDVKPANVLLTAGGEGIQAFLTDFGLSKLTSSKSGLTKTGVWVGTVDYSSPEQIQGRSVDARTDVYSLGCLLHQVLSGEVPFPKEREISKIVAHLSEPVPPISQRAPECPENEALDVIVRRAMAKDPAERYPSAGQLAVELTAVANRTPDPPQLSLDAPRVQETTVDRSAPTAG